MYENKNNNQENKYSESSGTGVLSAVIFLIVAVIVLYFLSKYI